MFLIKKTNNERRILKRIVEINIIVKRPAGKLRKELDYAVEIYS
jgi:hypothetical protein